MTEFPDVVVATARRVGVVVAAAFFGHTLLEVRRTAATAPHPAVVLARRYGARRVVHDGHFDDVKGVSRPTAVVPMYRVRAHFGARTLAEVFQCVLRAWTPLERFVPGPGARAMRTSDRRSTLILLTVALGMTELGIDLIPYDPTHACIEDRATLRRPR